MAVGLQARPLGGRVAEFRTLGDCMMFRFFPSSREGWLALSVLAPKTYVVTAYPFFLLCLNFAPRNRAASAWGFALLLGYLASFIWLAFGGLCQKLFGRTDRVRSTALFAVLALGCIWMLWPSLYGGF